MSKSKGYFFYFFLFFNKYLFLSFMNLQKYWDRTYRYKKKLHIISLLSLLCLAVASVCLTSIFSPLGEILKRNGLLPLEDIDPDQR